MSKPNSEAIRAVTEMQLRIHETAGGDRPDLIDRLKAQYASGELTLEEFEDCVEAVLLQRDES